MLVDTYFFHGQQIFLLVVIHILFLLLGISFGWIVADAAGKLVAAQRVALQLFFCGLFLSLHHHNILEWGFQTAWPGVLLFQLLAMISIFSIPRP